MTDGYRPSNHTAVLNNPDLRAIHEALLDAGYVGSEYTGVGGILRAIRESSERNRSIVKHVMARKEAESERDALVAQLARVQATPRYIWVVAFDNEEQYERNRGEIGYAATPEGAAKLANDAMLAGVAGFFECEEYAPESDPQATDYGFYQYWRHKKYDDTVKLYWYKAEVRS